MIRRNYKIRRMNESWRMPPGMKWKDNFDVNFSGSGYTADIQISFGIFNATADDNTPPDVKGNRVLTVDMWSDYGSLDEYCVPIFGTFDDCKLEAEKRLKEIVESAEDILLEDAHKYQ